MSETMRGMIERLYGQAPNANPYATGQSIGAGTYDYQSPNTQPFLINPGSYQGDDQASRTAAAIARAQYEDYKNRFVPIRNMLVEEATTGYQDQLDASMNRTRSAVSGAYDRAEGMQRRRLERYGVNAPGADFSRDETSSMVGGLNVTRQRSKERKMNLAYGGMNAGAVSRST